MNNLILDNNFNREHLPPPKPNNKFNLKKLKCNTCKSLYEVECFLNNFHKFANYIKLYKILK